MGLGLRGGLGFGGARHILSSGGLCRSGRLGLGRAIWGWKKKGDLRFVLEDFALVTPQTLIKNIQKSQNIINALLISREILLPLFI